MVMVMVMDAHPSTVTIQKTKNNTTSNNKKKLHWQISTKNKETAINSGSVAKTKQILLT